MSEKMNLEFEELKVYNDGGENPFEPGKVIVEPLERGFGNTMGNALRRISLSSIMGASVIGVKITGVVHEFMMIPGSSLDATKLILNLKNMRFDVQGDEIKKLTFKSNKAGFYTAKDLKLPEGIKIQNPEQEFIALTGTSEVAVEVYVKNGRGYVPAEEIEEFENDPEIIKVDGTFSPVKKFGYEVEKMRLGQDATYERLIIEITTDGSITPKEVISVAAKIARTHFDFFEGISDIAEKTEIYKEKVEEENRILDLPIEHLELSVRSYNGLKREDRMTVRKIIELRESELYTINQLGAKSVQEIIDKVNELGLEFKKD